MDVQGVSRIAVGEDLYLWRHPQGGNRCLISAHGAYAAFKGNFRPADVGSDVRLYFYSDHGYVLSDPGINVLDGNRRPVNIPTEGDSVPNYILSKYQVHNNAGGRGETYETVRDKIRRDTEWENTVNRLSEGEQQTYIQMRATMIRAHIITIRRRTSVFSQVALKDLVTRVHGIDLDGTRITELHCSFCRSNMFNPFAKSQQAPRMP